MNKLISLFLYCLAGLILLIVLLVVSDIISIFFTGYYEVSSFHEGLACVSEIYTHKKGFINKQGKLIISFKYDGAGNFSEGLAEVKFNGKWGYIDKSGKLVIPPIYQQTGEFSGGLAFVQLNKKYGFVDKSGKLIVPIAYDKAQNFSEGYASIQKLGKSNYINQHNRLISSKWYDSAISFSEKLAGVCINKKCGYINMVGQVVIPLMYDEIQPFSEGYAAVKLKKSWFYINHDNKDVFRMYFTEANPFFESKAVVNIDYGHFGFIDHLGKFNKLSGLQSAKAFKCGLLLNRISDSRYSYYEFINEQDKNVFNRHVGNALDFNENLAPITGYSFLESILGLWGGYNLHWRSGYINTDGKLVLPITFSEVKSDLKNDKY